MRNTLQEGTYARESDGATLLYHNPCRWNDASEALRNYRRGNGPQWGLNAWRRVDDPDERAAVEEYLCGGLFPGENFEYPSRDEIAAAVAMDERVPPPPAHGLGRGARFINPGLHVQTGKQNREEK